MGLAASSGRDNDDLVDKLVEANLIATHQVELVLRLVDRGRFFPEEGREIAYKDLAWKSEFGHPGRIHISAPCIYANVLECLKLEEGNSFLNIGSGTGYLNSVVGFLIGSRGTNHGIEIHSNIVQYARKLVRETLCRPETQCYDWAVPEFTCGNGLLLSPTHYGKYDRVYCGAAVPASHRRILWELLKIGGILVMPFDDQLQQVRRKSADVFEVKNVTSVSFSDFILPTEEETSKALYSSAPAFAFVPTLQYLCASIIRKYVRAAVGATYEIHMRDFVSQQPKRISENHAVIEYRDGEQPVFDEAAFGNRRPRFREIFAIVGPEAFEGEDDDDANEIFGREDPHEEQRRLLARERHRIEWFRQRLRAHIATRAARRRLREAHVQEQANIERDEQNNDTDTTDQNEGSLSSGSGSLSTATTAGHSSTSYDTAETNSDSSASSAGRSKKRSFLEPESENSLSAKRRNDDDNGSSDKVATTETDPVSDCEVSQRTALEENMLDEKVTTEEMSQTITTAQSTETEQMDEHMFEVSVSNHDCREDPAEEAVTMKLAEEFEKIADCTDDAVNETSKGKGKVSEECRDESLTSQDLTKAEDGNSRSIVQHDHRYAQEPNKLISPLIQVEKTIVHKIKNDEEQTENNVGSDVQCNKHDKSENTSEMIPEIGDSDRNSEPRDEEMIWQNNKLFKSRAETSVANRCDLSSENDGTMADPSNSLSEMENFKTAESELEQNGRYSVTSTEEAENSGDEHENSSSISSPSGDRDSEYDTGRNDDNLNDGDDDDDDDDSLRGEHELYVVAREAAERIDAVIGIEQGAAAAGRAAESSDENSDSSDDEYHDATMEVELSPQDVVPDEAQIEEEKKRELARLAEREQQLKDIERFALLFESRLQELPLNSALKQYIKHLY